MTEFSNHFLKILGLETATLQIIFLTLTGLNLLACPLIVKFSRKKIEMI